MHYMVAKEKMGKFKPKDCNCCICLLFFVLGFWLFAWLLEGSRLATILLSAYRVLELMICFFKVCHESVWLQCARKSWGWMVIIVHQMSLWCEFRLPMSCQLACDLHAIFFNGRISQQNFFSGGNHDSRIEECTRRIELDLVVVVTNSSGISWRILLYCFYAI